MVEAVVPRMQSSMVDGQHLQRTQASTAQDPPPTMSSVGTTASAENSPYQATHISPASQSRQSSLASSLSVRPQVVYPGHR